MRSLDDGERSLLGELGVKVFTMSDIDRLGVERAVERVARRTSPAPASCTSGSTWTRSTRTSAPGVGTPVRGGLSYREAHLAMELVAESGLVGSLEVVEVNPILDRENATAELAVELVASALGARIL